MVCSGTYSLPSITDISLQNRTSNHVNKLCGCLWRREGGQGWWSPQSQQHNQCNGQSEIFVNPQRWRKSYRFFTHTPFSFLQK
jgi:hypothetical protein